MTIEDMIDSLKKGVVNITFKKIDSGEISGLILLALGKLYRVFFKKTFNILF